MEIVITNSKYQPYGLSIDAVLAYAKRKGIVLYPAREERFGDVEYWKMPRDQQKPYPVWKDQVSFDADLDVYYNQMFDPLEIQRNDPDLVSVVETLGDKSGDNCTLKIVEVPDGIDWIIVHGTKHRECVAERHRRWE